MRIFTLRNAYVVLTIILIIICVGLLSLADRMIQQTFSTPPFSVHPGDFDPTIVYRFVFQTQTVLANTTSQITQTAVRLVQTPSGAN